MTPMQDEFDKEYDESYFFCKQGKKHTLAWMARAEIESNIRMLEKLIEEYKDTICGASRKGKQIMYVEIDDIQTEINRLKE